ncbi:MAG: GIY-YIG nuclease family protein [Spirochaetaceae bacterium]|jgi:predicted GIY-YIG superfamily endonuclease|nr:GIY-YIG nuclease family protein [Spirochaetaceae bacterium]
MAKQYIYIVQALLEPSKCKIGKTTDLERRLKEYNSMTGKSKENIYRYLFTCEVKNMADVENAIKEKYSALREEKSKEIYFHNSDLFKHYVTFIKTHTLFIKETYIKADDKNKIVKIVKRTTPSLEERGLTKKDVMQKAQKVKNDEFYTRFEDVEKEISMYDKKIWKNKIVFCNCDDAVDDDRKNTSAFALYFLQNFKELALKKLICTHYSGTVDLFNQGAKGYVFTKDGFHEIGKKEYPKNYTGSFDHPLSLKILNEEADIVCTNPPFSRAADYWKILIESGRKFLIISNETNVKNDAYIPYFMDKKVWTGYNSVYEYLNPKREIVRATGRWYTNLPVRNRPKSKNIKFMPLKDIPEKYKKYDDSKTLLVDNSYIPNDYEKSFAVSLAPILNGLLEMGYKIVREKQYRPYINGKEAFGRVLVQKI